MPLGDLMIRHNVSGECIEIAQQIGSLVFFSSHSFFVRLIFKYQQC